MPYRLKQKYNTMSSVNYLKVILLSILLCACTKPDYQLANGESGSFSDWKGKWVLINYWATWCAPCYEEIPELNQFHKARADVIVLGVNFDRAQGDALNADIAKMKITFPVIIADPHGALGFEQPSVLPATVILNPQGIVHTVLYGPQTQAMLSAAIEAK